ncbi:AraC family transcriptional regulator [Marinobacteraceae bacterium S3BR75-40.1]
MNASTHRLTVAASGALALAHYLISRGLASPRELEEQLARPLSELEDPDLRLPVEQHYRLWPFAIEKSEDPALGLRVGEVVDPDRMGLVGHVFFNCDTLGHALQQYVKLQGLINEAVLIRFTKDEHWVSLIWEPVAPELYCVPDMERTLAAAVTRARHFIHPQLKIDRLTLAHPEPDHRPEYERIFQCPLQFGAASTSLRFERRYLDWPLPHRNPYVYSALLGHVNRLLARMRPQRLVSRQVKRLISRQLPHGTPDVDSIAQKLHMSRQTLYRKLKHEGQSFQNLVEDVRRTRALRLVEGEKYALSEIAFLLGFSELSAFSRAFKRWTGESPARYRERHRQGS